MTIRINIEMIEKKMAEVADLTRWGSLVQSQSSVPSLTTYNSNKTSGFNGKNTEFLLQKHCVNSIHLNPFKSISGYEFSTNRREPGVNGPTRSWGAT